MQTHAGNKCSASSMFLHLLTLVKENLQFASSEEQKELIMI